MRLRRVLSACVSGWLVLACTAPAGAVIRVDLPVSKVYATARAVVTGTVVRVSPANRVLEVKVAETLKGDAVGDRIRVQIVAPAGLIQHVGAGSPLVLFVGKARGGAVAAVHLADTWLIAKRIPQAKTPAWRVVQVHDARRSFPGRTGALVRIVKQIQAGKCTLLDKTEHTVFRGGPAKVADVMPGARFLASADLNGDGFDEVLAGGAGGVKLLLNAKGKLADATAAWRLSSARGNWAAFGDVNADGRADLLLGRTLYANTGGAFEAVCKGLAVPDGPLAVALADATADGRPDVVALLPRGKLLVLAHPGRPEGNWKLAATRSLWTGEDTKPLAAAFSTHWGDNAKLHVMVVTPKGITRYAADPAAGPPADHLRLTGEPMGAYHKKDAAGWDVQGAAPIDIDGDGRLDFLVATAAGGEMLVNRGFGAFLINPDAPGAVRSRGRYKVAWRALAPDMPLTAADLHGDKFDDLLIVTKDGALFALSNTPFPRHP